MEKLNNETYFDIKLVTLSYESNFCQSIKVQNSNIHVFGLQLTCLVKLTMIIFFTHINESCKAQWADHIVVKTQN